MTSRNQVRRCLGFTRNWNRCNRKGDWIFFCLEHRLQPLAWLFVFVFTVLAGVASISEWWFSRRDNSAISTDTDVNSLKINLVPVVDLSIGQPFGSSTIITLKNSGREPIVDVAANLRCLLLKKDKELPPVLFFEGFPSIGNANSWWIIDQIDPKAVRTKDAKESLARCLHNRHVLEQSQPPSTFTDMILAVDIVYRREIDRKQYEMSGISQVMKDINTGEAFLWPLPMSDFYQHLLQTVNAPNYRMGPK
jgi:hypothetical protein